MVGSLKTVVQNRIAFRRDDRQSVLNLVYLLAFLILLPWVVWRRFFGGRPVAAPWLRLTGNIPPLPDRSAGVRRIWMHGVSVGEVQLLAVLAQEIAKQAAAIGTVVECVISSSTITGLELAARRFGRERTFACPLDFSWAVNRVLTRVSPDLLVLGELELWPNLLACTHARGIPIVVANARMSEQSARGYSRIRPVVRWMLKKVSLVLARSQADADRFMAFGATDVIVTGSMKFDGVNGDRNAPDVVRLKQQAGLTATDIVFLAGSTQSPEEQCAIDIFSSLQRSHPSLKLIIVPRHVERCAEIEQLLIEAQLPWQVRSQLGLDVYDQAPGAIRGGTPPARVLLVDTTGELVWWWGTATIAFVGGSLDGKRGGQNMLEPAAYGAAVSFGPQTRNFKDEVQRLLAADAAQIVTDRWALREFVVGCLQEPQRAIDMGQRAAALVASQRGATAATARRVLRRLTDSV